MAAPCDPRCAETCVRASMCATCMNALAAPVQEGYVLVPVEPTPEMVSAAEEAYMPFGDMDIALRMAILSAPSAPASVQGVNSQLIVEYPDEMANGGKMANCNTDCRSTEGVTVGLIDGLITIARVLTLRDLSPASVQEALIDLRSDEDLSRVLNPATVQGVNAQLLEALKHLLTYAEQQICMHEETHRGGAIWEICDMCGAEWADDRGGKPEFQWPAEVEAARAAIAAAQEGGKV